MKRRVSILVCAGLLILNSDLVDAAGKGKKSKGPETVLCQCGELIFEDDFSDKQLAWAAVRGEWKIVKKMLGTQSIGFSSDCLCITRSFPAVQNVVAEFRVLLTLEATAWFSFTSGQPKLSLCALRMPWNGEADIAFWNYDVSRADRLTGMSLSYDKPRWCSVVLEIMDNQVAATVDGRTIKAAHPSGREPKKSCFLINVHKKTPDVVLLDDVKVWEALPKDEKKKR